MILGASLSLCYSKGLLVHHQPTALLQGCLALAQKSGLKDAALANLTVRGACSVVAMLLLLQQHLLAELLQVCPFSVLEDSDRAAFLPNSNPRELSRVPF